MDLMTSRTSKTFRGMERSIKYDLSRSPPLVDDISPATLCTRISGKGTKKHAYDQQ